MSTALTWFKERSELGMSVFLAVLGAVVIFDASTMDAELTERGPVGPTTVPFLIGAMLLVIAVVLAVDVLRGGRGEAESGEDIDLSTPPEWRTVLALVGVLAGTIVLIEVIGFPLAGGLLFWGAAAALGSRNWLRDIGIAFTLSALTFVMFVYLLGVPLPVGLIGGVIG